MMDNNPKIRMTTNINIYNSSQINRYFPSHPLLSTNKRHNNGHNQRNNWVGCISSSSHYCSYCNCNNSSSRRFSINKCSNSSIHCCTISCHYIHNNSCTYSYNHSRTNISSNH